MLIIQRLDNGALRDTVAAVFSAREYTSRHPISPLQIIARWILNILGRLFGLAAEHPAVGYIARATLLVALLLALLRAGYLLLQGRHSGRARLSRRTDGGMTDWWTLAQRLAAEGDHTAAAHALYLALVTVVAERGLISVHDSKTAGDYVREIRRSGDPERVRHFTDFARSYETVIYGVGSCDAECFGRLRMIAGRILSPAAPGLQQG